MRSSAPDMGGRSHGGHETPGVGSLLGGPGGTAAAVVVFGDIAVVYLGATRWFPSFATGLIVSEIAFLAPIVTATVVGWLVHRRSSGVESRFWLFLTAANAVLLVSELYWVWWVLAVDAAGPPPVYAPFQVMHVAAAVLVFLTLTSMMKFQNATRITRWRYTLDLLTGLTLVYAAMFAFVVKPLYAGVPGVLDVERIAGAAYPTWGVLMLGGTLAALLGFKVSRWRPWERLVALALCIYAGGISVWPLWLVTVHAQGASLERGLLDVVLILGQYLFAVAAVTRLIRRDQQWPLRPMPLFQPPRNRRRAFIVPAMSLISVPVLSVATFRAASGSLDYWVYVSATSLMALLVVARTALSSVESGSLFHHAVTDPVTGLFNVRFLHERLAVEIEVAERYGERMSVVALDIDDFEMVNDLHGHPAGDDVLRALAAVIGECGREADIVCRTGGDEFVVLMPDAGPIDALKLGLCVQQRLQGLRFEWGASITVSMGIASFPEDASEPEQLLRLAEGARYWVKRHGKAQALVYDPEVVLELDVDDRIHALEEQAHLGAVRALAAAVDARDRATQDHSRRVAELAVGVARELGLDEQRVRLIESAATVHDVGKIGVPDDILQKPGPLSQAEWAVVREHPALGERILGFTARRMMLPWVRHHHERWDGTGYPDGLRAIAIPLEARILSVCDAYQSMTSERPYRHALSADAAAAELVAGTGSQFDPAVVEVFLRTLDRAPGQP